MSSNYGEYDAISFKKCITRDEWTTVQDSHSLNTSSPPLPYSSSEKK